ncbi:BNR-4 repeat-containing protein [Agromyces sp. ISL-38]|uniref:BNR-4 repeat-containing protein n=1 Tax=Agromyces sp. ISL-38 TaxID=2819107 RepID=UPI001BEB7CAD|nr:BNR-4 repeat-containing protein [Agromyces sp. ISL-38]MBT2497922.1 BNR-4 repeat-containing protein [Agromyces sp. ISL-38]
MTRPAGRRRMALAIATATAITLLTPAAAFATPEQADAAASVTTEVVADDASYQARRTQGGGLYDAVSDTTYIVWNASAMDIWIRGYDHPSESWEDPIKVAAWGNTGTWAYHDYAVLDQLPDGRLVVYGSHHTSDLVQHVAPTPHSAQGTWTSSTVSTDLVAYPEPVVLDGTVYLSYNRNDDQSLPYRTYKMIRSSDNGTTWSGPSNIIDTGKTEEGFDEVYVKSADAVDGRVCLTWTLAGGTAHNAASRNLYAACYDPSQSRMETLPGASLGTTVDAGDLAATLVLAAPTSAAVAHPVQLASIALDPATDELVVGVGVTLDGVGQVLVGRQGSGGWNWTTVQSGSSRFRDMTADEGQIEVLSMTGTTTLRADVVSGATVTNLWSTAVPYGTSGADDSYTTNFIEHRDSITAVIATINVASRTSDYSGSWPVAVVHR